MKNMQILVMDRTQGMNVSEMKPWLQAFWQGRETLTDVSTKGEEFSLAHVKYQVTTDEAEMSGEQLAIRD